MLHLDTIGSSGWQLPDYAAGEIKTFIPAFDLSSHMSHPGHGTEITPKKYVNVSSTVLKEELGSPGFKTIRDINKLTNRTWFSRATDCVKNASRPVLEYILPSHVVKGRVISNCLAGVNHIFNIASLLLIPVDLNLEVAKQRLQKKAVKCTELALALEKLSVIDPEAKERIQSDLVDLEVLKNQLKNVQDKKNYALLFYSIEIMKHLLANMALIWSFTPIKILGDLVVIVEMIPWISEILDFTLSSLTLKQTIDKKGVFALWRSHFQETFIQNEPASLQNRDIYELRKRKVGNTTLPVGERIDKFVREWKKLHPDEPHDHIDDLRQNDLDELLRMYIEHQEGIEGNLKTILTRLIDKKLELENVFVGFKNQQAKLSFAMAVLTLSAAIVFSLVSFGAAPAIMFSLVIASLAVSLSCLIAHKYLGYSYKSHSSFLLDMKIFYANFQSIMSTYWKNGKEKELIELNPHFKYLMVEPLPESIPNVPPKELEKYLQYKRKSEAKAEYFESLKERKRKNEWVDFAEFASLSETENVVGETIELLKQMDFDILEDDMKELLSVQLGFNLDSLANHLSSPQGEVVEKAMVVLERDLETFFTLTDVALVDFMKVQLASQKDLQS